MALTVEVAGGGGGDRRRRAAGARAGGLPCSAWLVRARARTGRPEEAADLFGQLVDLGGDLGLLPEEVDPADGTFLGNHPQALTHAALVHAAAPIRDAACPRPRPGASVR